MRRKLAELINVFFGLRKTIIMLLLMIIGIVFRVHDLVSGSEFVDLLKNTVLAFFAANGCEHILTTVNAYYNNKNGATPQLEGEQLVPTNDPTAPPPPPGVKL